MSYSLVLSESVELKPKVWYIRGVYDGDSSSFHRGRAELSADFRFGQLIVSPSVFAGCTDYDRIDPVFCETREMDDFGAGLSAIYLAPLGFRHGAVQAQAGYGGADDSIDFCDTETLYGGMVLNCSFGT